MPTKRQSTPKPKQQKCRHHWQIEPAESATSKGVCRNCGEEREFRNNLTICEQDSSPNGFNNRRPVRMIRHHVRGGPACRKCGKPMTLDTWIGAAVGGGIKPFWFCTACRTRIATFAIEGTLV
jgi:hypothetical protein